MGLCVLYYVEYSLYNVKKVGFFIWAGIILKALIPAQTMTESPPNRSCSATQTGAKRSFGILHTLARLSVKSTQNLDSSVLFTVIYDPVILGPSDMIPCPC